MLLGGVKGKASLRSVPTAPLDTTWGVPLGEDQVTAPKTTANHVVLATS